MVIPIQEVLSETQPGAPSILHIAVQITPFREQRRRRLNRRRAQTRTIVIGFGHLAAKETLTAFVGMLVFRLDRRLLGDISWTGCAWTGGYFSATDHRTHAEHLGALRHPSGLRREWYLLDIVICHILRWWLRLRRTYR